MEYASWGERARDIMFQADRLAERRGNGPLSVLLYVINTREYRVDITSTILRVCLSVYIHFTARLYRILLYAMPN